MIWFMLWLLPKGWKDLTAEIERAAAYFQQKYERVAGSVHIGPATLNGQTISLADITVYYPDPYVIKDHLAVYPKEDVS